MEMDARIKRVDAAGLGLCQQRGPRGEEFLNPSQSHSERKRSLIREATRHMSDFGVLLPNNYTAKERWVFMKIQGEPSVCSSCWCLARVLGMSPSAGGKKHNNVN